jgi:hypothetical protein
MIDKINKIRRQRYLGSQIENDSIFQNAKKMTAIEEQKTVLRTDVINYLLGLFDSANSTYLEIGVRNPAENFDKIRCSKKYSVDPGIEYAPNPVDFKFTSDVFFEKLASGEILSKSIKFHVIFIDGLHTANQTMNDIVNALNFINEDGFIVVHDCNPPTEYHAREDHDFELSPALNNWSGTTWKAFYNMRLNKEVSACCIDSDWGIGIISKKKYFDSLSENFNPFYEYSLFDRNRVESLNLISFEKFKNIIHQR